MKITWLASLLTLALLSTAMAQTPSPAVRPCLDAILAQAERTSMRRQEVNWDSVRILVYAAAAGASTPAELGPAGAALLGALGDDHGRILYNGEMISYWQGELKPHQTGIDPLHWASIQGGYYPLRAELLSDSIGYLRLPGLSMGDNAAVSAGIRQELCALRERGATCWILDLRGNGGGNIFPMLEGIGPLLGEGPIGSHRDPVLRSEFPWTIRNGNFFYGEYQAVNLPNDCPLPPMARVAILTSRYTASSGEMVAITFKARPNTRFFGEKTSGMITITNWATPCEGIGMSLSAAWCADRTGRIYRDFVDVDEPIEYLIMEKLADDPAVQKARVWLEKR